MVVQGIVHLGRADDIAQPWEVESYLDFGVKFLILTNSDSAEQSIQIVYEVLRLTADGVFHQS
jgi:hypothetical protein